MMENWEFDCPQFIDFDVALDSPSHEAFTSTPSHAKPVSSFTRKTLDSKLVIPKIKPVRPLRVHPTVKTSTDDEKLAALSKLSSRLSKSDENINNIHKCLKTPITNHTKGIKNNRMISLSEQCIRSKKIIPTTPVCLKRTLNNKKLKSAKTTEELEMQKITELQNMLQKRLRLNELNLKRLKMNKAPFSLESLPKKGDHKVQIKKTKDVRGLFNQRSKLDRILPYQNLKAFKSTTNFKEKEDSRGKGEDSKIKREKFKATLKETSSLALRDINGFHTEGKTHLKKKAIFESAKAHGGIPFLPSLEKTKPQPFSFDTSYSSLFNSSLHVNNVNKIQTPMPLKKSAFSENKENSFFRTHVSTTKTKY